MFLDLVKKQFGKIVTVYLLLLCATRSLEAQNFIEELSWKGSGPRIIALFIIVIALVILGFLFFYFRSKSKLLKDERELSNRLFREYVAKAELTSNEIIKLKQISSQGDLTDLSVIFQSIAVFEVCIEREIDRLKSKNFSSKEISDECIVLSNIRKKLGYNYLPFEHPIVSTRNIEIGQKVSIVLAGNKISSLHAMVIMNPEQSLRIQIEHGQNDLPAFYPGQQVAIAFARQGDGLYAIELKVLSFDTETLVIELQHTREMKRNQLRQFVRIEVNLPMKVRILQAVSEEDKTLVGKQFEAKMVDISGGGLSFILNRPLVPGQLVCMNFMLSTASFNGQTGKVLKVSLIDVKSATTYRHHVTFLEIDTPSREKIIKFVFEKQRQINQWR
jgi:c-di-GMP-binding flagellar brake protein YcgR